MPDLPPLEPTSRLVNYPQPFNLKPSDKLKILQLFRPITLRRFAT